jgi:hypothetical protein
MSLVDNGEAGHFLQHRPFLQRPMSPQLRFHLRSLAAKSKCQNSSINWPIHLKCREHLAYAAYAVSFRESLSARETGAIRPHSVTVSASATLDIPAMVVIFSLYNYGSRSGVPLANPGIHFRPHKVN